MSRHIPKTLAIKNAYVTTTPRNPASGGGGPDGNTVNPYTVTFHDTSTPTSTTRAWEFRTTSGSILGTSTVAAPVFVFPGPGTYVAQLTTNNGVVVKNITVVNGTVPGGGGSGGGGIPDGGNPGGTPGVISGIQLFPANNFWYATVASLPVRSDSTARIDGTLANSDKFGGVIGYPANEVHCDFGTGGIGMPYVVVESTQPDATITYHYPAGEAESDLGPMPIPDNAPQESNTDKHILVVQKGTNRLFELWETEFIGNWDVGQSTKWELASNDMRPEGWTSADAAGVPILPGVVRYDEVAAGVINHALRITVDYCSAEYEWPANHVATFERGVDPTLMKMGTWLRLKSGTDLSGLGPQATIIAQALKTHGAVVVDIGPNFKLSGAPSESWDDADLFTIHQLTGADFEVVDTSSIMVTPRSMSFQTTGGGGGGGGGGGSTGGVLGIISLAGAGGGIGTYNFGSGCDHPRASGVTTIETNGDNGTSWSGNWTTMKPILDAAAATLDQIILHGFSSGGSPALECLKRGYTFDGRLRGVILDDPTGSAPSNPANIPVKLYAVWTGSSWFMNDFYGRDWLGEIESALGITTIQNPYRSNHSPMTKDTANVGADAVPEELASSTWWT